eukprot:2694759-Rhodomonas_salina.1
MQIADLIRAWRESVWNAKTQLFEEEKDVRNRQDRGIDSMVHVFRAEEREGSELLRQWHESCGHQNFDDLAHLSLVTPGMPDLSKCSRYKCHCCWKAKATRKAHLKSMMRRATEKLGLVHMDFSGPFQVESIGCARAAVVEALKLFFAEEGVPLEIT